jgi:hypothetical protein
MLNFFTSSKKRLEQRMLKLCLNTEKPQAMTAMNRLGTPAWLVQPAAKSGDDEPLALNVIAPADRARGDVLVQPLPVSRKARR